MVRRVLSRSVFLALGLSALMLLPSQCWAQFYAGVYVGAAIPHEGEVDPTQRFNQEFIDEAAEEGVTVTNLSVSVSDVEFDAGAMVGGRVGYWLEALDLPFLGVEAEVYGAFPKVSDQNITLGTSLTANGTSGVVNVTTPIEETDLTIVTVGFNLLARYPFGPIQPYGGAGVGIVRAEVDDIKLPSVSTITVDGTTFSIEGGDVLFNTDDDTVPALQLIGGVRGFIADNVALFAEYKFVTTEFELKDIEVDYDASHVYGGIEFYFGPGVAKQ